MTQFPMRISTVPWADLEVVALLDSSACLVDLHVVESEHGEEDEDSSHDIETAVAQELRRSVLRAIRSVQPRTVTALADRLTNVVTLWQRLRQTAPLLQHEANSVRLSNRPAPRAFVEHVGSHFLEISWETFGGVGSEASAYEVEVKRFAPSGIQQRSALNLDASPALESLGCFLVQGGDRRHFTVRRLRQLTYHRIRVRALGPLQSWMSRWSDEVTAKTLSVDEAIALGRPMTADGFMTRSERRVCRVVSGAGDGSEGDSGHAERVDKTTLDARKCGTMEDFLRLGCRFSRRPSAREERLQRMRLVLAAQELYDLTYPVQCPWNMGPLYYEEDGHKLLQASKCA